MRDVVRRYDALWNLRMPYVLAVHQAPDEINIINHGFVALNVALQNLIDVEVNIASLKAKITLIECL